MLLSQAVHAHHEKLKKIYIKDLQKLGIQEYNGKSLDNLDYYEAKRAVTLESFKRGR